MWKKRIVEIPRQKRRGTWLIKVKEIVKMGEWISERNRGTDWG